jgi:hypothetical protein
LDVLMKLPDMMTATEIKAQLGISDFIWKSLRLKLTPHVPGKRKEFYKVAEVMAVYNGTMRPRLYGAGQFENAVVAKMFLN